MTANEKEYNQLSFSDDFIFCKVLSQNPELCRELIGLILNKEIGELCIPQAQKPIKITADGKGIRFDIYVEENGNRTVYDIEMQTTASKNLPKRSRYYQGMIDLNIISAGDDYNKLRRSYVIFICLQDPFGKGRHLYTFENVCLQDHTLHLEDQASKIFLCANASGDNISENLKDFLLYVADGKPRDDFSKKLDLAVERARNNEEWRTEYMTLLMRDNEKREEGRMEGRAEGRVEGRMELGGDVIRNLISSGQTYEQIRVTFSSVDDKEFASLYEAARSSEK